MSLPSGPAGRGAATSGDVLRMIRSGDATTRSELLEATGLSRAVVGRHLELLLERKLLVMESAPSTGGRPPRRFAFNPRAGVVLAADLGATHGRLAVADLGGRTLAERAVEFAIADGPESVLSRAVGVFDEMLAATGHAPGDVWATGIGVPGPVDFASGRPVRPPIMPGWDDFDIRGWLGHHVPGIVLVDNDVNVMGIGEYGRHWQHDAANVLYVKVGTGIGAGLIANGAPFRGARGAAGDIGHIRVDAPHVVVCDCGNENCLEAVAAGRALARDLRALGLEAANTRDVVALVAAGNPDAVRAVRDAGRRLGQVLAAAVNLLNPDIIVVGGDLADAHDQLLAGVREVVYQRSTALATQSLRVEQGRLGDDAGIEGCIVLALTHLMSAEVIDDLIDQVRSGATA